MTLALYGKSKRRQGSLLLLGVFAVFVALLAGLTLRQDSAEALDLSSANGTWGAIVVSDDASCVAGVGTNEIRWGDAGESCGALTERSGYRWDSGAAVAPITPGASFLLGKFTHFNHPIDSGGAPSTVPLALPLVFANPAQNVNLNVNFGHHETPNGANPCAYTGAGIDNSNGCADRVQLPNIGDQQFTVGGTTYVLEFTGFRPLDGDTCSATDPGGSSVDTFYTKEDAANRACIYAQLTVVRTVRVIKLADGSNTGTFGGTITPGGPTAADDAFSVSLTGSGNSAADVNTVTTDAQVVKETTLSADWSLVGYYVAADPNGDYNCSGSESYTKDGDNATTVPQGEGNYAVCIKNTKAAPSTPKLTIIKDVISGTGQDPQDFTFTVTQWLGGLSFSTAGISPTSFTLDDDGDATLSNTQVVTLPSIGGGDDWYRITEGSVSGWTLDDIVCTGQSVQFDSFGSRYVKVTSNTQEVTCTFKNKRPTIIVKKVVTGAGADAAQLFTANIINEDDSEGTLNGAQFSQNVPYVHGFGGNSSSDDFNIYEVSLPTGYALTGKKLVDGNGACPAADGAWDAIDPNDNPNRVRIDNLGNNTKTVCFRNAYTASTRTIRVVKVTDTVVHAGGTFSGAISPGGVDAANQTWSQTLAANAGDTNPGESNVTSQTEQTVSEDAPPANWASAGFAVVADAGVAPYACTGDETYSAGPAVVPAGAGNYVVCVKNNYTPPARNLTICKVVEGNGDLVVRNGQFKFDYYAAGSQTSNVAISASEPNPDQAPGAAGTKVCTTQPIPMPTDKQLTVTEWTGVRPAGWDTNANDAAGYPKVQLGDGAISSNGTINIPAGTSDVTVTFYNREKLPTKNVTFQKYICDTLGDVARNDGDGGVDQVGMPSISAVGGLSAQLNQTAAPVGGSTAVTPSNDGRGDCHLWGSDLTKYPEETGDWQMVIYDTSRSNLLQTVNIPQGGSTSVQLLDSVLLETLKASSDGARVEEELRDGYGFGALKCYTDHLNQDNWEWLDFNPGGIPSGDVYCIAYNVPADKEIVIEKRFIGAESWGEGDIPTFTFTNPSITPVCKPVLNSSNDHVYIVCTVPYDWNGTVSETPPAGWKDVTDTDLCLRQEEGQLAGALVQPVTLAPDFVFCNQPVGDVVIVKYENVPPATTQNWTFSGTLPGAPVGLSTTGTTNDTDVQQTTLSNVPAGSYTLAELQGQGVCESGDTSSDYQTRGLVQVDGSLPSAGAVNAAPIIGSNDLNVTVQKGTTTYVVFGNQGCGSVLSAANLQVFKYSDPAANFSGTTELAGWTISITGTAGAANGQNFSEDTVLGNGAFFGGIPDGTYTVCETPKAGWAVVGSKYNLVDQAGVCRTGVVANLDQTTVVKFYNQPRVNIEVNKTEISLATPAGGPGAGWSFTLTGCNITPQVAVTGANGKATFSDLPPAVGCTYTVTETVKSGWSAINPVQVTAPTAAGQTAVLNFTNVKIEVCTNCVTIVTPTPTPPTPTATATPKPSETPTSPTATPETPTQKPTEEATAGARTPGPGQTPIAPSTGNGLLGSGPAGVNMLLALVGLLAISLGTTILALGRKSSRR